MTAYRKVQAASKRVAVRSEKLEATVLETMKTISDIVGATLGPGGAPVLIERQEFSLPPLVTKDGVTVFSNLGFTDPIQQSIMESARDAAVRTVSEAGDGTTTATVLAYALMSKAQEFHRSHPNVPPQRIVQTVQAVFDEFIEPTIKKWATPVDITTDAGKTLCRSVATVSANGEEKLAAAVMEAFSLIGDKGNVSLSEKSGPGGYHVERVDGYPIATGFEDSCGKWMQGFVNDASNNRVFLENPVVLLYNGTISDISTLMPILNILGQAFDNGTGAGGLAPVEGYPKLRHPGVVVVANGFGDSVLAALHFNWEQARLKVYPVITPRNALINGEVHFLENLSAVTGARIFNPVSARFEDAVPHEEHEGVVYELPWAGRATEFEALRFRSTLIGVNDEDDIIERAEMLESMSQTAISELDRRLIEEMRVSLIGGIAKLYVVGSSTGDIRERKDRADDAVRAVQGAMKAGVLPGGGWTVIKLYRHLSELFGTDDSDKGMIVREVVCPALRYPFVKLLQNTGLLPDQITEIEKKLCKGNRTYDAANGKMVDAFEVGILDSTPAVLEAIRNSVSIATLLGTIGGVVVFERDAVLEREEARAASEWDKLSSTEIANERW